MKKFRTIGVLALFLVLGGGLFASQKLTQMNQDNRSSAAGGSSDEFCKKSENDYKSCGTNKICINGFCLPKPPSGYKPWEGQVCNKSDQVSGVCIDTKGKNNKKGDYCRYKGEWGSIVTGMCYGKDIECCNFLSGSNDAPTPVACNGSNDYKPCDNNKICIAGACVSTPINGKLPGVGQFCEKASEEISGVCIDTKGKNNNNGDYCSVNGQDGYVVSGLCSGNNNIKCCNIVFGSKDKINGTCGTAKNTCKAGDFADISDSDLYYLWNCKGKNGGTTKSCQLAKPATCSSKGGVCVTSYSGMTSGIKCTSGGKTGKTNMNYTCSLGKVCCVLQ
jgi:hypothetical protein